MQLEPRPQTSPSPAPPPVSSTLGIGSASRQAGISKHYLNLWLHLTARNPHSPFTDGQTELHPGRSQKEETNSAKEINGPLPGLPRCHFLPLLSHRRKTGVNFLVSILDFSSPLSENSTSHISFKQYCVGEPLEHLLNNEEETQKPEMELKDRGTNGT